MVGGGAVWVRVGVGDEAETRDQWLMSRRCRYRVGAETMEQGGLRLGDTWHQDSKC